MFITLNSIIDKCVRIQKMIFLFFVLGHQIPLSRHPNPEHPPSPVHPLQTEMGLTWLMQASLMISEPGSAETRETRATLDNVKIHRKNKNQS